VVELESGVLLVVGVEALVEEVVRELLPLVAGRGLLDDESWRSVIAAPPPATTTSPTRPSVIAPRRENLPPVWAG
jgi:hypothetical protein